MLTGRVSESGRPVISSSALIPAVLFAAYGIVLVRTAWMSDDAYITLRTVDNFINGYGLTWNVTERVQAYTHPLWMFLLSVPIFVTHEVYYTSIFLSFAVSMAVYAMLLLRLIAPNRAWASAAAASVFLSRAYVDFSSSGLENPLSHFLLAVFLLLYLNREPDLHNLFLISLVACLGCLNRLDTSLLFLPVLFVTCLRVPRFKGAMVVVAGFVPLMAWEVFSILYYGFPFPNTAYAKLNTDIPSADLLRQGGYYLLNSLENDPVTLTVIAIGIIAAVFGDRKKFLPVAVGVLLYLAYTVRIGGDFMSGRFLTAPFLCSAIMVAAAWTPRQGWMTYAVVLLIISTGAISSHPPILSGRSYALDRAKLVSDGRAYTLESVDNLFDRHNIIDERAVYFQSMGLLRSTGDYGLKSAGKYAGLENAATHSLTKRSTIGVIGYYSGPTAHIIDNLALADALLARLPAKHQEKLHMGHFARAIPVGYIETIHYKTNLIADPKLAAYYDKLRLVISAPLFSPGRLRAIYELNTSSLDHLIDRNYYRFVAE